jgi:tetratricopeptide (TPR) repeat protein
VIGITQVHVTLGPRRAHITYGAHWDEESLDDAMGCGLMKRELTFRQTLLSILALWYDKSQKEIAAAAGLSQSDVSHYLRRPRSGEIKDETFARLLAAIQCPPGAASIVTACLEALEALEREGDLTPEERGVIEETVLEDARTVRAALTEAVRLSRAVPSPDDYPGPHDVLPARLRAEELFIRLEGLSEEIRLTVVRVAEDYQTWYLCERVCLASVQTVSRDLESGAAWARLALEIAERVRGPEEFRNRIQGYALAHAANLLRVSGELKQADATFDEAKRLWQAGSDPGRVLDPGRLLDLEASLRIDQRRLDEALELLEEAATVSRFPGRLLIKKAVTLEKMDEHERAVEALLQAEPLVVRQGDGRLLYMLRFNLAVNYCHIGRYCAAAELMEQVREVATERGDENEVIRLTWLQGRIAAGLGRPLEARSLLAQARRAFELRGKSYDVALALLEEAVLLLDEGQTAEVKALAGDLTRVFEDKGVHREALAALRLFCQAAEREEATAELARRVLRYLFRSRDDQSLRFHL